MANGYRPGAWRINQSLDRVRGMRGSVQLQLAEIHQLVDNTWTDEEKRNLDELLFELTSAIQTEANRITAKLWTETIPEQENG